MACERGHTVRQEGCPHCPQVGPPHAARADHAPTATPGHGRDRRTRVGDRIASGEIPPPERRSLPCVYLGGVVDRGNSTCIQRWLYSCSLHGSVRLQQCKTCPDYQVEG